MPDFDPSSTDSARADRFAAALERVADTTERHGTATDGQAKQTRRVFFAVLIFTAVSGVASVVQQYRQNTAIESLHSLTLDVREARDEARGAREDARKAASEASDAREEISLRQLQIEPPPPSPSGKPPKPGAAVLRIPSRPATSTSPAVPAASVPIVIGASTSGGAP